MTEPRIVGIRHHSPACAHLVAHLIRTLRPAAVLIEGPCDFNERLSELRLPHQLPIALYSYTHQANGDVAQCWFPWVGHSPEWVALQQAQAHGIPTYLIDLPHWAYRTTSALPSRRVAEATGLPIAASAVPDRLSLATQALAHAWHCDGVHALWDHVAEGLEASTDVAACDALAQRLHTYFDELRGPDPATPNDHGMVRGSYLVPYSAEQLEALGGYQAGVQSPLYHQWLHEDGPTRAAEQALAAMVAALRHAQQPLSTADLVAYQTTLTGLMRVRGHPHPLRTDVLDAALSAFVKEALSQPPPWTQHRRLTKDDHPVLRLCLTALTGTQRGQLAANTPLPPLVQDVQARMAQQRLACRQPPQRLTLDRRNPHSQALAHLLWQLHLIGAQGITPHAPHTAAATSRHLLAGLLHEEHWTLSDHPQWLPSLIEAAAYGATLPQAARACLLRSVPVLHTTSSAEAVVMALTRVFTDAIRAGFFDLGDEMAEVLQQQIPLIHDHAALAQAMHQLLDVMHAGFWGQDTRPLLHQGLQAMTTHLLSLIEQLALHPPQPNAKHSVVYLNHSEADVLAVQVIARLVAQPDAQTVRPTSHLLGSLLRHARAQDKPPALRGAALGVVYAQRYRSSPSSRIDLVAEPNDTTDATQAAPAVSDDELLRVMTGLDSTTALGDALYGLVRGHRRPRGHLDAGAIGRGHRHWLGSALRQPVDRRAQAGHRRGDF